MNGCDFMERKEVIAKFRKEVRPFVLTRVVDTGEFYVLEPEIHEKVENGTILYQNYCIVEAHKRLLAKGHDV